MPRTSSAPVGSCSTPRSTRPAPNPENVALGQLLVMKVDDFDEVYDID
jgi:hypothetical protein